MSVLNALGGSPLLSLIGWTVVSAFTLGAAAAALVLLCRGVAPRLTAAWQHRLFLALYALSLAGAFAIAAVPRKPAPAAVLHQPVFGLPVAGAVIPAPPGPSALTTNTSRVDRTAAVQEAVGVLGLLAIGLGVLALARLCAGLWMVGRLRRNATPIADADVLAMVDSLAGRMRIRGRIALRESPEVDTAMTGGWLRPFVLLPPGMHATLGSEIEPVLAHELAHVRRRDFAVAVLQAIADAGTRLSPGHRWLSLEASRVREQACDDVVVTLGVEPLRYARALEALGHWSRGVQVTNVVCAANRHLAARVRRLLEGPRKPRALTVMSAIVLLSGAAFSATLVAAAAPGLPAPRSSRYGPTLSRILLSGREADQASGSTAGLEVQRFLVAHGILSGYNFHQPNSPVRIDSVSPSQTYVYDTLVLRNVFAKQITAVMFNAIIEQLPAPVAIMSSPSIRISLDPTQQMTVATRFVTLDEASKYKRDDKVQLLLTVARVEFEDGTQWGAPIDISARSASDAIGIHTVTLPREFVSVALP